MFHNIPHQLLRRPSRPQQSGTHQCHYNDHDGYAVPCNKRQASPHEPLYFRTMLFLLFHAMTLI